MCFSVTKWHGLCETNRPQEPPSKDVDRTSRHSRDGQRRHEARKGEQGSLPTMSTYNAANTPGEVFATCLGRSTIVPQIYLVSSSESQALY
jgi:hypothetical protein